MRCETFSRQRGQKMVNIEAEESALLGTVTSYRLVKTEKAV
jgi:hypothetical protein